MNRVVDRRDALGMERARRSLIPSHSPLFHFVLAAGGITMVLQLETGDVSDLPTRESLAERLDLPESIICAMTESIVELAETARSGALGTELVRARLYEILDPVEAELSGNPEFLRRWAAIRAELFRTMFAGQRHRSATY